MFLGGFLGAALDARRNKRLSEEDTKDWEAHRERCFQLARKAVEGGNPVAFNSRRFEEASEPRKPVDLD
jgi:hypothetical protein